MSFHSQGSPRRPTGTLRRTIGTLYLLIAPLWFNACRSATAPAAQLPTGAVAFAAPAVYRTWWALTQTCSGLTGDMNTVRFYQVPATSAFVVPGSGTANGVWYSDGNIIVVAGDSAQSGQTVRHEMLHALIGPVSGHPAQYFYTKCGGVVACVSSCATEALGAVPTVDPTSPIVDASILQLESSVAPATFASARSDGWVTLLVKVTNQWPGNVRLRIPAASPGNPYGRLFGYDYNGNTRTDLTTDAVLYLPAGATRQRAFDIRVSLLDTGARLRGAIAAESTAVITLPPG